MTPEDEVDGRAGPKFSNFARNVRALINLPPPRGTAGSVAAWAKKCGLPQTTVARYVSGQQSPTESTIDEFARAIGVPSWQLLLPEDARHPEREAADAVAESTEFQLTDPAEVSLISFFRYLPPDRKRALRDEAARLMKKDGEPITAEVLDLAVEVLARPAAQRRLTVNRILHWLSTDRKEAARKPAEPPGIGMDGPEQQTGSQAPKANAPDAAPPKRGRRLDH